MNTTLEIQNLKCGGCANTITTRLSEINDIDNLIVNNDENTVSFTYSNNSTLTEATKLLSKLGYPIVGESNPLSKKAKSFVSCAVGRISS